MTEGGWGETLAAAALLVSAVAVWLSVRAGKQAARFHPQPKLVVEWNQSMKPIDGIFFRAAKIHNHGDAPARQVRVVVEYAETTPWESEDEISAGGALWVLVPVVDRVSIREGSVGRLYPRSGAKDDYAFVTPVVTINWLQAPFDAKPRVMRVTPPHTPNMREGETS